MSNSTEILPKSTEGLPFYKPEYKLNIYSITERKVQIMDKVLRTTELSNLLTLTLDEIMDVQGGEDASTFDVIKNLIGALIKWGGQS